MFERFFDETGGMQLVVHSPFGGRVNRSLGLALRKKFCRTFNFELQAAASDDAIVLSLGPHHSFPLQRGARLPQQRDGRRHARARDPRLADVPGALALEPQPFADGAALPGRAPQPAADPAHGVRRPHGRGVPAGGGVPGECHRSDRDPRPRAGAPDHQRHAARGARRRRHPRRCSSAWRPARCRCTSPTPPSRRCSRTRSSPRGRTRSSTTRSCRTAAPTRSRCGAVCPSTSPRSARSTRRRSSRCTARSRPSPRPADDLADLLASLVVVRPRPDWQALFDELAARGRAVVFRPRDTDLWCATERRRRRRSRLRRRRGRDRAAAARPPRDQRHHHRRRAGRGHHAHPGPRDRRPRVPGAERLRAPGHATPAGRGRHRVGVAPVAGADALLLPSHAPWRRRARHRPRLHALPAAVAARGAGHAAGRRGRTADAWSSSCRASTPPRWRGNPTCSARGCAATTPPGSTGSATTARWRGCAPTRRRARVDAPAVAPSKATPISLVARVDLPWLLMAARAGGDPGEPVVGAHRRGDRGAARARGVLRRRARHRHQPPARRHRARAVGRRGARAGHVRRLRRHPVTGLVEQSPRIGPCVGRSTVLPARARHRASPPRRPDAGHWCPLPRPSHCSRRSRRCRSRRAGRGRRRAAAAPVGRAVPRPRRARLAAVPVARPAVGAAAARRPRAGAGRSLRQRVQRRAVRAARPPTSSSPRCVVLHARANGSP